ncbi:adenosylcobinamide-phosphate synthase CbiB [Sphingomonas sp. H39-1-10]|uniref:adenosylcobinamide-phosphate synthase CbiB n=1 Tax=Sphingomonas pollutisoli TaxID=3030829 RepID=UPI0023B9A0AF|nr:adenosylcobinamide-phosphate synthase CbiB [Sphingomonas pollutisoli]MDF0488723.1 adenosylcobinamide-phosphate synthase CbiB [Sphingomonas pollutisoli]
MAEPVALVALAVEAAVGWPTAVYARIGHPVGAFAAIIAAGEAAWNRPFWSFAVRRAAGVLVMLGLIAIVGGGAFALQRAAALTGAWGWLVCALLAAPGLAQRSLFDHVRAVQIALRNDDLDTARRAVAMIVGRDTHALDTAGVARAAIESLAESFCDAVAAPLFWLLVAGLPGLWVYKAVNTADSLVGHREPRWRAFGWAAARTDDSLNLIPARLGGVLLCVVGARGWRVLWRDAGKHASPNAGWTEAAMAGALGLSLAGPIAYDTVVALKPWIGDGRREADARDIGRALALYVRACLALWLIAGGVAWLL